MRQYERIILVKHQQHITTRGLLMKDRNIRVYYAPQGVYPKIILQGKWLRDAGFQAGDFLSVSVQDKELKITIKKDKTEE